MLNQEGFLEEVAMEQGLTECMWFRQEVWDISGQWPEQVAHGVLEGEWAIG